MTDKYIDICEGLGWSVDQISKTRVELAKRSPAGEDFRFEVEDHEYEYSDALRLSLKKYVRDFDPDDHAEMFIRARGKYGVPASIKVLIDDAHAIRKMLYELEHAIDKEYGCQNMNEHYLAVCKGLGWEVYDNQLGLIRLTTDSPLQKYYVFTVPSLDFINEVRKHVDSFDADMYAADVYKADPDVSITLCVKDAEHIKERLEELAYKLEQECEKMCSSNNT